MDILLSVSKVFLRKKGEFRKFQKGQWSFAGHNGEMLSERNRMTKQWNLR